MTYFGLRRYLPEGHPEAALEMGSEPTPDAFIAELVAVFREVRRVLRPDGVCFVNLGDSYAATGKSGGGTQGEAWEDHGAQVVGPRGGKWSPAPTGYKPKDLMMMPARVALALQADGWWLRSQMPWVKRSCMPESTTDRPTSAIEYVYLLTKGPRYFWDPIAVQRKGAIEAGVRAAKGSNVRSELKDVNGRPPEYWDYTGTRNFRNSDLFFDSLSEPYGLITDASGQPVAIDVNPAAYAESHFATFPPKLVEPLIRAGTSERGACPACGAPWERVVERVDTGRTQKMPDGFATYSGDHGTIHRDGREKGASGVPVTAAITTGWRPTCACEVVRCVSCAFVVGNDHDAQVTITKQRVPDLRSDVPGGQADEKLLFEEVLRDEAEIGGADSLRPVRQIIPAEIAPREVLQQVLFDQVDGGAPINSQGLDDHQQGVQATASADTSECKPVRIRAGTPAGDGKADRPTSDQERDRPSQERRPVGQSDSQPGTDGKTPTRRSTKASLSCDVPALSDDVSDPGQCPNCGSRMERTTPTPSPCIVLDCFAGAFTAPLVADRLQRDAIGIELSEAYCAMARARLIADAGLFADLAAN